MSNLCVLYFCDIHNEPTKWLGYGLQIGDTPQFRPFVYQICGSLFLDAPKSKIIGLVAKFYRRPFFVPVNIYIYIYKLFSVEFPVIQFQDKHPINSDVLAKLWVWLDKTSRDWSKTGQPHLVGGYSLPPWKIWVRQLGWWHSQYMESHNIPWFQTTSLL